MCPQIWLNVNDLTSREQNLINSRFYEKRFSVITFDSGKARRLFCHHRVSLVQTRRINYKMTLKSYVKKMTWGKGPDNDLIGKCHVAFQSIHIDYRHLEHIYCVLIALDCLHQKLLPKKLLVTYNDLKWPWRTEEGSLIAIFPFREVESSSNV